METSDDRLRALCAELQATWHNEIPLAAAIGVEVTGFDNDELIVRAPLAPNTNLHGTAFAGSLYSICVLTSWGMAWLTLRRLEFDARIVVTDSRIGYTKAVTEDIVCRSGFDASTQRPAMDRLIATGRTAFALTSTIQAGGAAAVSFEGRYDVRLRRSGA